jgi:hypothetical protein
MEYGTTRIPKDERAQAYAQASIAMPNCPVETGANSTMSKANDTPLAAFIAQILACADRKPCVQSLMPMVMIFQGRSINSFQASQQRSTMFS